MCLPNHHPLNRRRIFVLAVKTQAHAVEFAALQALVELAALAEWAHDHVGGDGERAQVSPMATRARGDRASTKWMKDEGGRMNRQLW